MFERCARLRHTPVRSATRFLRHTEASTREREGISVDQMGTGRGTQSYAAFISYRHADVDSAIAREVQQGLERLHIPRAIREETGVSRLSPVFRDKEELSATTELGEEIASALANSSALILVCSPRTKGSPWIMREIDTYLETHDRSRVFTVLAEGDSHEVIPERLLYREEGGTRSPLEPLSCDFRSPRRRDRRVELERLASSLLGVSFDSLVQRTRRRRSRILSAILGSAFALVLAIAIFALQSNARIRESYEREVAANARLLLTEADRRLEDGDRLAAIELAAAAMPQEGEGRVQPDVVRLLTEATGAYELARGAGYSESVNLIAKHTHVGTIQRMSVSENERFVAALSGSGLLNVWDASTAELLFETQVSGFVRAELVMTEEGRVVVGHDASVTCWDVLTGDQLWDCDTGNQTQSLFDQIMQLLPSEDSAYLVALGNACAYRIDMASGAVTDEVEFLPDDGISVQQVARFEEGSFACDLAGNRCVFAITGHKDLSSDIRDRLCTVDFETRTASLYPNDFGWIHDLHLLDGQDVLISYSEGDRWTESNSHYDDGLIGQQAYIRHIGRLDLVEGKPRWDVEVPLHTPARMDSLIVLTGLSEDCPFEAGDADVLAYCTSNVCEVHNLGTGERLARFEAPEAFVVAWPTSGDDGVDGLRACLSDGRSGAVLFTNGICSSYANEYVRTAKGMRVGDHTYVVGSDCTIYRYADTFSDKSFVPITDTETSGSDSLCTDEGVVIVDKDYDAKRLTLSMIDAGKGDLAWQQSIEGIGMTTPRLMALDSEANELYVCDTGTEGSTRGMYTVHLDTGLIDRWDARTIPFAWDGEAPMDIETPIVDAYGSFQDGFGGSVAWYDDLLDIVDTNLIGTEGYADAITYEDGPKLVVTDLGKRTTSLIDLHGLRSSMDPSLDADVIPGPDGKTFLVPLRSVQDGTERQQRQYEYGLTTCQLYEYALLNMDGRTPSMVDTPLSNMVNVTWSDRGDLFAACAEESLVVCDTKGRVVFEEPLANREMLSLHFMGNRLLTLCIEADTTMLLSYDLSSMEMTGRMTLTTDAGGVGSDVLGSVRWMDAPGRNSDRDPGDLCIYLPPAHRAYLIDSDSLELCQVVYNCLGYDARSRRFVVYTISRHPDTIGTFERHTADELLAYGLELVGGSHLTVSERQNYGLSSLGDDS